MEPSYTRTIVIVLAALGVSFALAALLTPPDPFSQLLVAGTLLVVILPLTYGLLRWYSTE